MKIFTSKDGLIYEGASVLSAQEADALARINGFVCAERLVDALIGKDFKTDANGKITGITESTS